MAAIELNVNREMLDLKFEGYKLSLDPMPVLRQSVVDEIDCVELSNEEFSYLHVRMSALLNRLFQDAWNQNNVFYINKKHCVYWSSLSQDGRLAQSRLVWKLPTEQNKTYANATLYFPSADWSILCNGRDTIYVLHTPSRAAGEPWMCYHKHNLTNSTQYYILHAIHRNIPSGHQIDCLIASTIAKSSLECNIGEIKEPQSKSFVVLLEWISFSCGQNIQLWSEKRMRKLMGLSVPEYAAIDSSFDAICLASESQYKLIFDSAKSTQKLGKNDKDGSNSWLYTYAQYPEELIVFFQMAADVQALEIEVKFFPTSFEVYLRGQNVFKGELENAIITEACSWTLKHHKLKVTLEKLENGLMWETLIKGCNRGREVLEFTKHTHDNLACLTGEKEVVQNTGPAFNLEQLEECDDSDAFLIFQRIDGNTYIDTHRVNMGGHQWLFKQQTNPESLPALCLRHDVDGILWQPHNISSEGEKENFKIEHSATFHALGYVQASKQDKKFILCSPDFHYSVISDCSRHAYIYSQPENLHSALELRNRKTGESVSHIAKQYVVSLEQCDKILGMQVSSQCIFVLGKHTLYAVKFLADK